MTPLCWNFNKQFYMLISSHPDGRLISKAVSYFQIKTISGSSSKNKLSSTKKILKLISENKVIGITPDGPRGPRMVVKKGISSLAKSTNAVILPSRYQAKAAFSDVASACKSIKIGTFGSSFSIEDIDSKGDSISPIHTEPIKLITANSLLKKTPVPGLFFG